MKLREEIINKISEMFKNYTLGEFENKKDSFFEALAKSINQINELNRDSKIIVNKEEPNKKITSKKLRKLCHNFYKTNTDLVKTWHAEKGGKKDYSLMEFDATTCNAFGAKPLAGRSKVEGRILYQVLRGAGLGAICIIDVEVKEKAAAVPKIAVNYSVIDKDGYKDIFESEAQALLNMSNVPVLVVHNKQYVPLLRTDLQQQNQIQPRVAAAAVFPVADRARVLSPFFARAASPSPVAANEVVVPPVTIIPTPPRAVSPASAATAPAVQKPRSRTNIEKHSFTVVGLPGDEIMCRMECKNANKTRRSINNAFKKIHTTNKPLFVLSILENSNIIELRPKQNKKQVLTKGDCQSLIKAYYEKIQTVCIVRERACPSIEEVFIDKDDLLKLREITIATPVVEQKSKKRKAKSELDSVFDSSEEEDNDNTVVEEDEHDHKSAWVSKAKRPKTTSSPYFTRAKTPTHDDSIDEEEESDDLNYQDDSRDEDYEDYQQFYVSTAPKR
jgi:hypothetical protein